MGEQDKRRILYDAVSKDYELGTYEEFSAKLDNPTKRKAFYDGVGSEYQLGSYEEFESKVLKKKETSQPTSPLVLKSSEDTAQQSGILESEFVPSQSNAKVQPKKQQYVDEINYDPFSGGVSPTIGGTPEYKTKKSLISVGDYTQTKEQRLANIKERIDTEKDKLPTTIKEYLIDYGVKNPYDIGLNDNFNPDKKITRDEIYKFNNYLIQKNNRELKEREAEIDASKYKGVPAWLGMNYFRSLSTGINQGSANLFKRLDGALNMILDAGAMLTNQDDQLENLRKKGYETVFKRAADYIEENTVKPYQDLDPDALQTAVNALGQMNSFFMEMAVPITKTSGATEAILKMPAVMGFDGATETYSELTKSNTPIAEKIKESAVAGGKGAEAGMVFSLMGVGAKMLSQPIKNEYAQVLTEMALNSGGFGAYAGLTMGEKPDDMTDEEWESKRKKEIISNTILGGIMGAKHLPEQLLGASYARAMRTSADNIKKVMDMNIDSRKSEEILKNIVEIDKQLKELEDSPENQNKKIELQLAKDVQSNTLMLNLGAKTIQANPTYVKEKILQSEQSELDKQQQLQKVSEISNMSKQIQEADAVSEQIKTKQKEIGFVESDINNGLGDQITNNSKKTLLEKDIKDLEKQQQEILSRDKTEEILGTSESRPTEQVTDKVNDIVKPEVITATKEEKVVEITKEEPIKPQENADADRVLQTPEEVNPALKDVESTAKALGEKGGVTKTIQQEYAEKAIKYTIKNNGGYQINESVENGVTLSLSEKDVRSINGIRGGSGIQPHPYANIKLTPNEVKRLRSIEYAKEFGDIDGLEYSNQKRNLINDIFNRHLSEINNFKSISEAYHKAKSDGSNPELVKAVEELLSQKKDINATETKEVSPTQQKETKSEQPSVVSETKSAEKPISEIKPSPAPAETGLAKSDIEKQVSDKYYSYSYENKAFTEQPNAKKVELDVDGDFFYVKSDYGYTIYEAKTGSRIGQIEKSLKEAKNSANERIKKSNQSKTLTFENAIKSSIEKEGISPRYAQTNKQLKEAKKPTESDIVKKYVEEIKTKEDISETKKTEATKKISDGLSEISEITASKLQAKKGIVEDTDVNFRESLKKVAEGVYDLSVLKPEELIDKVKEVFKKTFEGEQLREIIKQINNNSEEIAALYYDKKGEKLKKTELQKQIDKAVGQTTKLNREYSKLKRDMLFLEKGDNATEAEKYNNFLFKVRDIVSDAKKEGEIDYDIADKILSEIEKTTKFKKELTRESKRIEALVKIENLITENVVSTQHDKLTKDIEKQIGQRLQKQGSKQKGYTIEEWDFKNNVDALLKTKTDLNKANTELEQKLSETTDPKEEANLMEKMMIVDYASRVKEYEDIILNFDKLSLNEKREAITKLTELKEYFKDKTKDFIEKYKEEVQQRAEHKQKLRETSEKGTRRKDYDSKVRLLENVLKNSESKEDILFELISNSDKSVSEKLNKKSQKLLALNDVDFRLELQKILGVKLESKSERDIEDTKSKIFVFHPLKALENLRGLTETVFGLGGKENYKPINEIMDRIDDSPRVMERLDVKMRNMIDNTVDVLDKKIKNIRNDKTSKLGISIKGKNGKEAPELYELSYTQVVSIALQMRQDLGYISAVKRYGEEGAMRLQNHVESIIKNTPTLKQYADSVLNFYKENYDAINEVYRKIYKTDMPNIDGYVPLTKISEILETIGMEVGVDGAANKRGTLYVSPSNLNKRKGGGELDISKDAEQVMNNYRKQMSDFVAYAEVKREMIELFTDPQVRANIKSISGGDTYLKYFDLYLNNFPNVQRTDTVVAERIVTSLFRNFVISALAFNPKMFFIQAASASNFSAEMVYDAAWKELPAANQTLFVKELFKINKWSEYIDQFKKSPFRVHRLQQGFDRDFQAFANNRFIPTLKNNTNTKVFINKLANIIENGIKTGFIKAGDIASFLGGMPVYYQQKEILRKENPNLSEEALRVKAFEKMATLGEKSLQSSYVHLLSPYQLSRVSKLTPYMSNPIQFQQKQFKAIRTLSRGGGSAKDYARSVNSLLMFSIGQAILFEAMQAFYNNVILGKQYDDEDENPIQTDEQKKLTGKAIEWIGKGFMQGVPVAGESIEFIGLKLQKKKGFQPEASGTIARANDVLKTTLDITSFLADNYTSKDGFDWDKIPKSKRDKFFKDMRATLEYAGWNTKPMEKIIDRIKDGTAYPITLDIYKQAAINRYVKTGNPDMINDLRSKGIITKQVKKAMLKRALKLKEGKDYTDEELENEVKKEKKKELKEEKIKELKLKDND